MSHGHISISNTEAELKKALFIKKACNRFIDEFDFFQNFTRQSLKSIWSKHVKDKW